MKSIGILLLFGIWFVEATKSSSLEGNNFQKFETNGLNMTEEFDCPSPGGAFPHPEFCDYYYVCVENKATLNQCPADQLFDLKYSGCNWDYLVDCGERLPPGPPVTDNPDFKCPQPGGAFPHPVFCDYYYVCVESKATLNQCPADQLFDLTYSGCNWDYLVECGERLPPGPPVTDNPDFKCPQPGGAFPHPELCDYYYVCVESKATLNRCPAVQLFDLVYSGCNWDYLVDCGDRRHPDDPTDDPNDPTDDPDVPTTNPPEDFVCPKPDGLFPNPKDCTSFYNCANNNPILTKCPDGLYFSIPNTVCDYPNNVDCGDRPIPPAGW